MSKIKSFITITIILSFTIFTIHLSASENNNSHFVDDDITGIINCYLEIIDALVADDADLASINGKELNANLKTIYNEFNDIEKQESWEYTHKILLHYSKQIANSSDLHTQRIGLKGLTLAVVQMLYQTDTNDISLYLQHCSMALNNGAEWLSVSDNIANPYFGSSMVTCGEILERVK